MSLYTNAHLKGHARLTKPSDFMPRAQQRDPGDGMPNFNALASAFKAQGAKVVSKR